jgi:hypothetical protein
MAEAAKPVGMPDRRAPLDRRAFTHSSGKGEITRALMGDPGCTLYRLKEKMTKKEIAAGVVHRVPADLRKTLISAPAALVAWENITPLARNEWICWIEDARNPETRSHRIERTRTELREGKRRPCCWAGCIHR